jgi:hypothetical protein
MTLLTRTLTDPFADCQALQRGRHGLIGTHAGQLESIRLRPWPKIASVLEVSLSGGWRHRRQPGDRCWLYYDQPRACPNFLALKFVVSQRDCTLATLHRALEVLDEVARVKRSDAIVCDVWNLRISDRALARSGWEPHKPARWHRHFIKRFYGTYPAPRGEFRGEFRAGLAAGSTISDRQLLTKS